MLRLKSDCDCGIDMGIKLADTTHYKETECMRQSMEQMMYDNGVDIVLNGHLHEYERTKSVFVSQLLLPMCTRQYLLLSSGAMLLQQAPC